MALQPEELFGSPVSQTPNLRAYPAENGVAVGTLAALAADADVAHLTPLSHSSASGFYSVWDGSAGVEEITTLVSHATTPATAGSFTLTVDGVESGAIPFDANAAEIEVILEAMANIDAGDVAAVATAEADLGVAAATVTLTWGGAWADRDIEISGDMSGLTGNAHVLAEATAGTSVGTVDALLWAPDEAHAGLLAGETSIQVFKAGLVHADDVVLPASQSLNSLRAQLKSSALRQKGITVQGLSGVA
jgi:hypothetical protein